MIAYELKGERCSVVYVPTPYTNSGFIASTLRTMGANLIHSWSPTREQIVAQNIRHHCDVIVEAWYQEPVQIDFAAYVQMVLDGGHPILLPTSFYSHIPSNYYLRYQTLQLDLDTMMIEAGLPNITIPLAAGTTRPPRLRWFHFFPYRLKMAVGERYKDEMERLGFNLNKP